MDLKKLTEHEVENLFEHAYQRVSETDKKFPQDVLLYFYAYYKHAKNESDLKVTQSPINGEELVNAFKANAMFQVKTFSQQESKLKYIRLAQLQLGDEFDIQ